MLDKLRRLTHDLKTRGSKMMVGKKTSQQGGEEVDEALKPIEKELQGAIDHLRSLKQAPCTPKDVRPVREVLGHVDSLYHEGKFTVEGVEGTPRGQAKLTEMLNEAHTMLRERLEACDFYKVAPEIRSYHDRLVNIQHALDSIKEKPGLSPKDLRPYRQKLAEIDAHYEQGRFEVNHQFPEGQASIAELLTNAHETIRACLMKTDYYQVDEALYPLHDRLISVILRLESLASKDSLTEKDLARLREKLNKIDAQYKEGKFEVEGRVPEGQAIIADLLEKAHQHMQMVQDKIKT